MHAFSSFSSTASSSCSTPNTMLYTRHGHVPNLTSDLFDKHIAPYVNHGRNLLFQVLLPSIFDSLDVIDASGGLREFCRMPGNSLLHFTLLDPLAQRDTVTNKFIYVWNKRNRKKIDMNLFKVALKAMRVDSFSTPFDFDTPIDCSDKRMQKSLKRSSNFLRQINGDASFNFLKKYKHI